jgi:dihydroneopterin aldolase
MILIHLNHLEFFGYHGILPEEKILGGNFIVDAEISFREHEDVIHSIKHTIDYGDIFMIIQRRMLNPTPLLEEIVMDIGVTIKQQFEQVSSISISLKKLHPPIAGLQGSVGVTWKKDY